MKLMNHIKYRMFRWLMDDICINSGTNGKCNGCWLYRPYAEDEFMCTCLQNHVFLQAYQVWMSEE